MTTISEKAKEYEPKKTKNVSELESFELDQEIFEGTGQDSKGKDFEYNFILVDNEEYRIANPVLEQIKALKEANPKLAVVKVKRTGENQLTRYQVIPLK